MVVGHQIDHPSPTPSHYCSLCSYFYLITNWPLNKNQPHLTLPEMQELCFYGFKDQVEVIQNMKLYWLCQELCESLGYTYELFFKYEFPNGMHFKALDIYSLSEYIYFFSIFLVYAEPHKRYGWRIFCCSLRCTRRYSPLHGLYF